MFNSAQLTTWSEARELTKKLLSVGGGVKPETNNPDTSGIYIPVWFAGPSGFPRPHQNEAEFLHFRFNNGAEGMNVGLILDKFRRYPSSPLYVISELAKEAARMIE